MRLIIALILLFSFLAMTKAHSLRSAEKKISSKKPNITLQQAGKDFDVNKTDNESFSLNFLIPKIPKEAQGIHPK